MLVANQLRLFSLGRSSEMMDYFDFLYEVGIK